MIMDKASLYNLFFHVQLFQLQKLGKCAHKYCTEPVFIKPICKKKLIFKLISFQGYSQTSFLVSLVVYLTFIRIDLSTITQEEIYLGGRGDVDNVN